MGVLARPKSSWVITACTPGSASAADASTRVNLALAWGLRSTAACSISGQANVVDEARAPGEQPRILAALDRLPDQPRGHGSSPRSTAAARRTAPTICW